MAKKSESRCSNCNGVNEGLGVISLKFDPRFATFDETQTRLGGKVLATFTDVYD